MVTRGLRVWVLGTLGGGDARLVVGSSARLSGPWNLEIQDNFTDEDTIGILKN
jgi:subtilisin-like proprotein convertase family protein